MNTDYMFSGSEQDIAVTTRVRLARNLQGFPFPCRMTPAQKTEAFAKICGAVRISTPADRFSVINLEELGEIEAISLMETRKISPELLSLSGTRGILLSRGGNVSIMVNEEDCVRIQVMGYGECLDECLDTALKIDSLMECALQFAFDDNLGYLTSCPTNLGTGLRAGVMLHLPALTETGLIQSIAAAAGKLSVAVRGANGEGSAPRGSLYQLSNQNTLGTAESELSTMLQGVAARIISEERKTRQKLMIANPDVYADRAWRSAGILKNARLISYDEASELISGLRLGVSSGIIDDLTIGQTNDALMKIPPATVQLQCSGATPAARDGKRAEILRKIFGKD